MLPGYFIFGLLIVWKLWTAVSYNCFGIPWYERKSNCRLMWCILEYVRHMSHPVQSIPGRCRRQTVSPDRSRDDNIIMATGQHYSLADCPSPAHYHMLHHTVILAKQFMFTQRLASSSNCSSSCRPSWPQSAFVFSSWRSWNKWIGNVRIFVFID